MVTKLTLKELFVNKLSLLTMGQEEMEMAEMEVLEAMATSVQMISM
jgi:hypothetical protein